MNAPIRPTRVGTRYLLAGSSLAVAAAVASGCNNGPPPPGASGGSAIGIGGAGGNDGGSYLLDLGPLGTAVLAPPAPPGVDASVARAKDLVAQLTQEEKLSLVRGTAGTYVGNVGGVPRLGIPPLTLQDGPAGVARFQGVTAFPAPITVAASWDPDLAQRYAAALAAEERGKGAIFQLGPMMNLVRVPLAGRNFESFGEDPYLASTLAAAEVQGIQSQKVVATAKHFVGNEQETNRTSESSNLDERTLHEVYYAPFEASVAAGVGAVMCSYNRLNSVYACENPTSLGDLKTGMGFSGLVMSDWDATHSTIASANAGLDLEMPSGTYFGSLGTAIADGTVPQSRLDDMVTRVLGAVVQVGALNDPPSGTPDTVVASADHTALALEAAKAGTVLLRNNGGVLPIRDTVHSIAVFGTASEPSPAAVGGGSAYVIPPYVVAPFGAIQARAGSQIAVTSIPVDAVTSGAVAAAKAADLAVMIVAVASSEGRDRSSLSLDPGMDSLIGAVADANPNTVVVLHVPGAVLMPWISRVAAVLVGWFPGQENGNALAAILFGDADPGGRLPVTFPASAEDLPAPNSADSFDYTEGLGIGYRGLDARGVTPLFPFGHGLSYTTFGYSALAIAAGSIPGTVDVSFTVQNQGTRAGTEVPQLYLAYPDGTGEPPKVLRGFTRVNLASGEQRQVTLTLTARDLSIYDPTAHARRAPSGTFKVGVGRSSRDLQLVGSFNVRGV